jgi:hypothetical protein
MEVVLTEEMFENNRCVISYGNREALITIIDEEFAGNNRLGRINRITILAREFGASGKETGAVFCSTVIGLGDGMVGIRSGDAALIGKLLTRGNMSRCVVELREDG